MPELERDERFHLNLEDIKEFAIFRVSPEGRIVSWNTGAERLKGYRAEEILGQPFAVLFTPEDAAAGKPEWEMRQAAEKGVYQGEGVRVRKGGERFDAEVTLRALADVDGVHRGFVKITRDISARKRFEAELRQRAEFEQQLIGIVSHDLRTPLSAITLATALLLRSDILSERHTVILGRILSSSERALRMISSLLDFSQARVGGGFTLHYSSLDLREFLGLLVEEVRLTHPGRDVLLEVSGDGRGKWDSDRLAQLLTNLLNNALQHGLEDEPVRLRVSGGPDGVVLEVHNRGTPIPPDALPHLFEPMRRGAGAVRSSKYKSVGLGLYIVQQIVLSHRGTIEVSSSEAEGTTFTVRLPRHPPAARAPEPEKVVH
ncbi:MAG TPA: PAS domain-containing sensor histidine kinase [Archangium sp.]|nr:PAS domain-containing sensor histidine kinase [Archangium sp.]